MSRSYWMPALSVVAALSLFGQTPNFEVINHSIVKVRTHRDHPSEKEDEDETGTGFIVSLKSGVLRILTASHVVVDATKVEVTFDSEKVTAYPAKVLPRVSDALDLAVLEMQITKQIHLPQNLSLSWAPNDAMRPSEHIWTVNGDWEPVPNTIIRLDHGGDPRLMEYTHVSVGEGYSGGPVFDDNGLLLGLHVREASHSDYKLSIAVKIGPALETLEALGYSTANFNGLVLARGAQQPQPGTTDEAAVRKPTPPPQQPGRPILWRNLNNNQLYTIRVSGSHMYIAVPQNGSVVADLGYQEKKNGVKGYFGNSSLSTCPGAGYMEVTGVTESRIEGRVEVKPGNSNINVNANCGGLFGRLRQMAGIAFIREQ